MRSCTATALLSLEIGLEDEHTTELGRSCEAKNGYLLDVPVFHFPVRCFTQPMV